MGVVGIAARSTHVGLTDKHAVVDGRLFVATVQAWGGPRFTVATVYRFTGGRLEAANLGMLQALGAEVRTIGLPLPHAREWFPDVLGSVIVAPMSPHGTCVGQGGHPVIEYFVISHGIAEDARARRELAIRQLIAEHVVEQSLDAASALPPDLAAQLAASEKRRFKALRLLPHIIACNGRWASAAAALTAAYRHVAILTALEVAGQVDVALSTAEVEAYGGTAALGWSTPCWLT